MNGGLAGIQSDLDQAAQIAGRYDVCTSTVDVLRLSQAELASELRLQHVVGPGGATAEVALGYVNNMEATTIKDYDKLFAHETTIGMVAASVARRAFDISELVQQIGFKQSAQGGQH